MHTFNIHEAKTHLSKLLDAVTKGEEILIARTGKPVAKLSPLTPKKPKRRFGVLKGKIKIAEDFNAPLPDDILEEFEK